VHVLEEQRDVVFVEGDAPGWVWMCVSMDECRRIG
jgi:hypothetical protein